MKYLVVVGFDTDASSANERHEKGKQKLNISPELCMRMPILLS